MHEAGIARRAIQAALERTPGGDRGRRPVGLEVVVDPRLGADSLAFHLELVLRELGLAELPVVVTARPVRCSGCGASSTAEAWLLCESCGAPLPPADGPEAEARFRY